MLEEYNEADIVYAIFGFLTSLSESVKFGCNEDASVGAEMADAFVRANGWTEPFSKKNCLVIQNPRQSEYKHLRLNFDMTSAYEEAIELGLDLKEVFCESNIN